MPPRLAQANAVDDARVVQFVGDHGILGVEQRFEQAAVGIETRRVKNGVLRAEEVTDARLQFLVDGLGAADETDGGHAVPEAVERCPRGGDHLRMVREPEIIVRTQVQNFRRCPVSKDIDFRLLRPGNQALRLVEPLRFQFVRPAGQRREKTGWHAIALVVQRPQSISAVPAPGRRHPDPNRRRKHADPAVASRRRRVRR